MSGAYSLRRRRRSPKAVAAAARIVPSAADSRARTYTYLNVRAMAHSIFSHSRTPYSAHALVLALADALGRGTRRGKRW